MPTYRGCVRLLGAVLRRWMRDVRDSAQEEDLAQLAEWLDMSLDDARQKVFELMTVETRGRRPGGPGGRPRLQNS